MYNDSIKREKVDINGIPTVIYTPNKDGKFETIIYYHGWGSNCDTYELMGQIFALYGFQFVMPEIINHGVRGSADYPSYNGSINVTIKSVEEFSYIYEYVSSRHNTKRDAIGISGHSLGGIIASLIFSEKRDLKYAILYNAVIDVKAMLSENGNDTEDKEEIIQKVAGKIPEIVKSYSGRDMLFLEGENDSVLPIKYTKKLEEKMDELNIDRSNIVFSYYPVTEHSIAYKMVVEALKFLEA